MTENTHSIPDSAPLTAAQKAAIADLLPTLTSAQSAWLSGYLAAIAGVSATDVAKITAGAASAVAPATPADASPALTVLYGTESGNSETCAAEAVKAANAAGFKARMFDMGDYPKDQLAKEKNLMVIVSTWGEGDPPERAVEFHQFLHSKRAPMLSGVNFAVCALGDTSYADFCLCGIQFDQQFEKLGAKRIHPRVDCDVDFEEPFRGWMKPALEAFAFTAHAKPAATPTVAVVEQAEPVAKVEYSKQHPFPAPLTTTVNLNGTGSAKETYHLEFSLEGSGFHYKPGDVLGVIPRNCEEVVDDLLRLTGMNGAELVDHSGGARPLADILLVDFDVTTLNARIMDRYAPIAANPKLDTFLRKADKEALANWLWGRELRDLLAEFPPAHVIRPEQLFSLMRRMPPRLYSIASSLRAHPGEVHLTVGIVSYMAHGILRKGVCSTYLGHRVKVGETVPMFIHHNKNFALPESPDTPIIMVGPGTGIAPFRAFIEERDAIGAKGRSWLFFGDQHFNTDFLYQTEWQDYLKRGILSRMDVAFSRDTDHKIYVQHRMKEKAADLYAWLQDGAHFYVCGDANRMARDVHHALVEIYAEQGAMSIDAAEAAVKQLQKDRRYQRDVY